MRAQLHKRPRARLVCGWRRQADRMAASQALALAVLDPPMLTKPDPHPVRSCRGCAVIGIGYFRLVPLAASSRRTFAGLTWTADRRRARWQQWLVRRGHGSRCGLGHRGLGLAQSRARAGPLQPRRAAGRAFPWTAARRSWRATCRTSRTSAVRATCCRAPLIGLFERQGDVVGVFDRLSESACRLRLRARSRRHPAGSVEIHRRRGGSNFRDYRPRFAELLAVLSPCGKAQMRIHRRRPHAEGVRPVYSRPLRR